MVHIVRMAHQQNASVELCQLALSARAGRAILGRAFQQNGKTTGTAVTDTAARALPA